MSFRVHLALAVFAAGVALGQVSALAASAENGKSSVRQKRLLAMP